MDGIEKSIISVIVPVYRVEAYLDRCIQSILNQTYKNLEIILVDDGSPDNSGKICDQYAEIDDRIKVIHKENGGLSDARNTGIDIATGDYLGFVDSDDFIHREMYETLYLNITKTNSDISIGSIERVKDYNNIPERLDNKISTISSIRGLELLFTFKCSNLTSACNKLFKRELFEEIRFPKGRIREDESTAYKLIFKSKSIVITEKLLYYYHQTNDSIMHNQSMEKELHFAYAQEERIDFFAENNQIELYKIALKRYCIWLICMSFMYNWSRDNEQCCHVEFNKRRKKYIERMLTEFKFPAISQFFYRFAIKNPYLPGFFAFQKLYRYNLITKISEIILDDRLSLNPIINKHDDFMDPLR